MAALDIADQEAMAGIVTGPLPVADQAAFVGIYQPYMEIADQYAMIGMIFAPPPVETQRRQYVLM